MNIITYRIFRPLKRLVDTRKIRWESSFWIAISTPFAFGVKKVTAKIKWLRWIETILKIDYRKKIFLKVKKQNCIGVWCKSTNIFAIFTSWKKGIKNHFRPITKNLFHSYEFFLVICNQSGCCSLYLCNWYVRCKQLLSLPISFFLLCFRLYLWFAQKKFTCSIVSRCLIDIVHIFITDGLI